MKKRILPIVVIYGCELKDSTAYQSLLVRNGIEEFVVYDNSPAEIRREQGPFAPGVHYFHDAENGGLSKAYNYGAKLARELGFDWLLLLDQDTDFPKGAFDAYEAALEHDMLLVPNVVLSNGCAFSPARPKLGGFVPMTLPEGEYALRDYLAINSGCCVPLSLFTAAGGYNDAVRLDFSDYQFQRRLRKVCDRMYVLPFVAKQDFSNEETDVTKLLRRFELYLDGARHCDCDGWHDRMDLHLQVLKHSMALCVRTHRMQFLLWYFKKYLFR